MCQFDILFLRGNEFRTDYSQLGMLSAFFPNAVMIALTATANAIDRVKIKEPLNMKNPVEVIGSANRRNIFYSKIIRESDEVRSYYGVLKPIAERLKELNVRHPLTIIYLSLKLCGFAYKLFESILGKAQYYPTSGDPVPERRMFA